MKKYGLIGHPLSHSFSKRYFEEKFTKEDITDIQFELFDLDNLEKFQDVLHHNRNLCGVCVTIPYKIDIIPYLDWLSDNAKEIGSVNCIRISEESPVTAAFSGEVGVEGHDFRLEGFNTDSYGFETSLKPLLTSSHNKALVLGNGGAALAVKHVLGTLNIEFKTVTRKPFPDTILFKDLTPEIIEEHKLIINCTPLGTSPIVHECPPIPYEEITEEHLLYDLIYNPERTLFLQKGEERGAAVKNGYEMLVLQAEKAWEIWNSKEKHP